VIDYWPLLGIALVVLGFALKFNPLLVVAIAAIVTGLLGGMPFFKVLAALGHGFNQNRNVTMIYIVLPVIGMLERYGLQQQARALIRGMKRATVGRLLIIYMVLQSLVLHRRCGRSSRRWRSRRLRRNMESSTRTRPSG
jgi:uncharacterized membrane protein